MQIRIGTTAIGTTYGDDELRVIVDHIIDSAPEMTSVGFLDICTGVLTEAAKNDRLDNVDGSAAYQWESLTRRDSLRVMAILAAEMKEGELMRDYDQSQHPMADFFFIRPLKG